MLSEAYAYHRNNLVSRWTDYGSLTRPWLGRGAWSSSGMVAWHVRRRRNATVYPARQRRCAAPGRVRKSVQGGDPKPGRGPRVAGRPAFGLGPIGDLSVREIKEEAWLETWKASFKPIRIGAFLVRPTWSDADPGEAIVLSLDPGMAFGTGLHPTTQACLRALSRIDVARMRVADVGTGSAILAIACAKRGAREVVAVDIDEVAAREAKENVARNGVGIDVGVGSASDLVGTFDVVLANIVAAVLQKIAPHLAAHLGRGGRLVVAGIIATEEDEIRAAFAGHGLRPVGREQEGDWVTLELTR
jgi:ribosomal protein L11 methyltransferase